MPPAGFCTDRHHIGFPFILAWSFTTKCAHLYTAASVIQAVISACLAVDEQNLPHPPPWKSQFKLQEMSKPSVGLERDYNTHTPPCTQIIFTSLFSNFCKANFHGFDSNIKRSLSKKVLTVPSFKHFSDTNSSNSTSISLAEDLNSHIFFIPEVLLAPFTKYGNKDRNASRRQQRGEWNEFSKEIHLHSSGFSTNQGLWEASPATGLCAGGE